MVKTKTFMCFRASQKFSCTIYLCNCATKCIRNLIRHEMNGLFTQNFLAGKMSDQKLKAQCNCFCSKQKQWMTKEPSQTKLFQFTCNLEHQFKEDSCALIYQSSCFFSPSLNETMGEQVKDVGQKNQLSYIGITHKKGHV